MPKKPNNDLVYELTFDPIALKQLQKLPLSIRKRIFTKLEQSLVDPFHFFKRLVQRSTYRMRVGNYRIIADIDQGTLIVLVLYVGHRREVYD